MMLRAKPAWRAASSTKRSGEDAVEEAPGEDREQEQGHQGDREKRRIDPVRERPEDVAERQSPGSEGGRQDEDQDEKDLEGQELEELDGPGAKPLFAGVQGKELALVAEIEGTVRPVSVPERVPERGSGSGEAGQDVGREPRGDLPRIRQKAAVGAENGQPEVHGVQGRDGAGPEQLEIGIGRIEEGEHFGVEGQEQKGPAERRAPSNQSL